MFLRVGTIFDLTVTMKPVIFRNKATKNLYDYAALVKKILRLAQDDTMGKNDRNAKI